MEFLDAPSWAAEEQLAEERNNTTRILDIRRASSLIFDVVRKKYHDRLERERMPKGVTWSTCPVIDGSLNGYFDTWDKNLRMVDPRSVSMDTPGGVFAPDAWGGGWGNQPVSV